jgi:hypothetical protein
MQGSPAAECSGSNDRDVRGGFHGKRQSIPVLRFSGFNVFQPSEVYAECRGLDELDLVVK